MRDVFSMKHGLALTGSLRHGWPKRAGAWSAAGPTNWLKPTFRGQARFPAVSAA
jgi:hypothetical protein